MRYKQYPLDYIMYNINYTNLRTSYRVISSMFCVNQFLPDSIVRNSRNYKNMKKMVTTISQISIYQFMNYTNMCNI